MESLPAIPPDRGNYLLFLRLDQPTRLWVGRLGEQRFPAGVFAYAGSAFGPGGLRARLGRHLGSGGALRWHIDYLNVAAVVLEAWWSPAPENLEHCWAAGLMALKGAVIPIPGFGSSDCRCPAHLVHLPAVPRRSNFRRRLRAGFPDGLPRHRISRWMMRGADAKGAV